VALSSRSPALGVTQQVWSFGSPDFPQTVLQRSAITSLTFSIHHFTARGLPHMLSIKFFTLREFLVFFLQKTVALLR
jgi:hypothetical protein